MTTDFKEALAAERAAFELLLDTSPTCAAYAARLLAWEHCIVVTDAARSQWRASDQAPLAASDGP